MRDYKNKKNHLSNDVKNYLTSMKAAELNVFICEKYGVAGDDIIKHTDLISSLFFKEVSLKNLISILKEKFGLDEMTAKKMACDIAGMRLLIIQDWLGEDVTGYIKFLGGDPQIYEKYIEEQKKAVIAEEAEWQKEIAEENKEYQPPAPKIEPAKPRALNLKIEKQDALEMFKNSLAVLLQSESDEYFEDYNLILIKLLAEDGSFGKDAANIIRGNQEKLTHKNFILDGKPARPTIGHWLKDFIKQYGAEIPDNLKLSRYLTSSGNIKNLDEAEKAAVRKLLGLYRNLAFFPQSMPNQTGEGWEIIPMAEEEKFKVKSYKAGQPDVKQEASAPNKEKTQRRELQALADQYPAGSLERRAVEEEIRKMQN